MKALLAFLVLFGGLAQPLIAACDNCGCDPEPLVDKGPDIVFTATSPSGTEPKRIPRCCTNQYQYMSAQEIAAALGYSATASDQDKIKNRSWTDNNPDDGNPCPCDVHTPILWELVNDDILIEWSGTVNNSIAGTYTLSVKARNPVVKTRDQGGYRCVEWGLQGCLVAEECDDQVAVSVKEETAKKDFTIIVEPAEANCDPALPTPVAGQYTYIHPGQYEGGPCPLDHSVVIWEKAWKIKKFTGAGCGGGVSTTITTSLGVGADGGISVTVRDVVVAHVGGTINYTSSTTQTFACNPQACDLVEPRLYQRILKLTEWIRIFDLNSQNECVERDTPAAQSTVYLDTSLIVCCYQPSAAYF